jgi:hypothetical protein
MNLKLMLAAKALPKRIIKQELFFIAESTVSLLNILLREHTLATDTGIRLDKNQTLPCLRKNMALTHVLQVKRLVEKIGLEKTLLYGREKLNALGIRLGQAFKQELSIGSDIRDALYAAKIMYRILAIKFKLNWISENKAWLYVTKCALADYYSKHTCAVLCAADEGVVSGINKALTLKFESYLTQGNPFCRAELTCASARDDSWYGL